MRILLVEDEDKVSSFVARGLAEERFAVDVAADGKAGLDLATTYHYDLVILDLMLPTLDGSQVLRRIRTDNVQVPVLILTARDAVADKVGNFEAGPGESPAPARASHPQQHGACGRSRARSSFAAGQAGWETDRLNRKGIFPAGIPHVERRAGSLANH